MKYSLSRQQDDHKHDYVRSSHQDKCHTPLAGQLEDACCLASLVYTVTSSFPVQTIKWPSESWEMPQVSHTRAGFPANPGDLATMCHAPLAGQLEDACCLASLVYTVTSSFPVQTIKQHVKPGNAPSQRVRPY